MKNIVIMVHGLGRSRFSMLRPGLFLKKRGFSVFYYSYNSTRDILEGHFAKFAEYLSFVIAKHADAEINFVTHSMGGILVRGVLTPEFIANFANLGRIVMLAPPNRGSNMAARLSKSGILREILKPLEELSDAPDSKVNTLSVPQNMKIGIISGKFDAKVKPKEAFLTEAEEYLSVDAYHTFIMNRRDVMKAILNFLNRGTFERG